MGSILGQADQPDCLADRLDLSGGGEGVARQLTGAVAVDPLAGEPGQLHVEQSRDRLSHHATAERLGGDTVCLEGNAR